MKPNSWIVNGVMALAIIVLFVLHFNSNSTPIKASAMAAGGVKVAYFEIDSIQNSYNFFKDVKAALQAAGESARIDVNGEKALVYGFRTSSGVQTSVAIDKHSITNAYPKSNIK